jgi:hypothetical protein
MEISVFVTELRATGSGILAKATNGGPEGPRCDW